MNIKQKRIILTGATGGIGTETAKLLAEQGANLVLVGRNKERLEQLKSTLHNPEQHLLIEADLTKPESIDFINNTCLTWRKQGIHVNALINNAGSNRFAYLAQRTPESIEKELQLNLISPVLLSQKALGWLERPGLILNIGSTFAAIGYPGYSTYCAGKAGLHRFSEAMQRELSGAGIQVLYLAPRATDTKLNDQRVLEMNKVLGNQTDKPVTVAKAIVTALKQEKTCRWLGWPEKLFVRINQIFPRLVSSSLRQQHEKITEFASKLP
ncbi:SDR family oxidoreductase [Photobacterium sp. J15]|uniref:SDR family oxidoreductase n=1 Tax=Photobacterium sp. J15 TaxID=265901 RepID=UPI0007E30461|nr:SDR family oxidoreductase [Photobacterium sp. J15]